MNLSWLIFLLTFSAFLNILHTLVPRCRKGRQYSVKCNKCWCIADGFPVCSRLRCRDVPRRYWKDVKYNHFYTAQGNYYVNLGPKARSTQYRIKNDNVINNFFEGLKNITYYSNFRGEKIAGFTAKRPPPTGHNPKLHSEIKASKGDNYYVSRKKMRKG